MPTHSASSRRSIRLTHHNYSEPAYYFFTLCVVGHKPIFGRVVGCEMECNLAGTAVWEIWYALPRYFPTVELNAFVVMPNHVHGIVFLRRPAAAASSAPANPHTLGRLLRTFKSLSAAAVNRALHRSGSVWQRNYYDHIVRSGEDLDEICVYIAQNPAQWQNDRANVNVHNPALYPFERRALAHE